MSIFADKVNAASAFIASLTNDPAERLGISAALMEIYRYDITKSFVPINQAIAQNKENRDAKADQPASADGAVH